MEDGNDKDNDSAHSHQSSVEGNREGTQEEPSPRSSSRQEEASDGNFSNNQETHQQKGRAKGADKVSARKKKQELGDDQDVMPSETLNEGISMQQQEKRVDRKRGKKVTSRAAEPGEVEIPLQTLNEVMSKSTAQKRGKRLASRPVSREEGSNLESAEQGLSSLEPSEDFGDDTSLPTSLASDELSRVGAFSVPGVDYQGENTNQRYFSITGPYPNSNPSSTNDLVASVTKPPLLTAELVSGEEAPRREDVEASVRRRIISEAVKAEAYDETSRRRRWLLIIGILLIFVVAIVLGVVFGLRGKSDNSSDSSSEITPPPITSTTESPAPSFAPTGSPQGLSCNDAQLFPSDGTELNRTFVGASTSSETYNCLGTEVSLNTFGVVRWFSYQGDGLAHATTVCVSESEELFNNTFVTVLRGSCGGGLVCEILTQHYDFEWNGTAGCRVAVIPTRPDVEYTIAVGLRDGGLTEGNFALRTVSTNDSCESQFLDFDYFEFEFNAVFTVHGATTASRAIDDLPACGPDSITGPVQGNFAVTIGTGNVLTASSCGSSSDTQISVFTGSSCETLECVVGSNNACGLQGQATWLSVPGERYYLYVHSSADGSAGEFQIEASESPPFDVCEGAEVISLGDGVNGDAYTGTTVDATVDYQAGIVGEFCNNVVVETAGVWYSMVGNGTQVTASTCLNSDFGTRLTVYSGSCDNLTCVSANDNSGQTQCPQRSRVSFFAQQATAYFILVHGNREKGRFTLEVSQS